MKTLSKYIDGELIEIKVSDKEYKEAVKQAKEDLEIETEEEAKEREDEIEEYVIDYFEEQFEEEDQRLWNEYEDQQNYYKELNSWLNKQQGV